MKVGLKDAPPDLSSGEDLGALGRALLEQAEAKRAANPVKVYEGLVIRGGGFHSEVAWDGLYLHEGENDNAPRYVKADGKAIFMWESTYKSAVINGWTLRKNAPWLERLKRRGSLDFKVVDNGLHKEAPWNINPGNTPWEVWIKNKAAWYHHEGIMVLPASDDEINRAKKEREKVRPKMAEKFGKSGADASGPTENDDKLYPSLPESIGPGQYPTVAASAYGLVSSRKTPVSQAISVLGGALGGIGENKKLQAPGYGNRGLSQRVDLNEVDDDDFPDLMAPVISISPPKPTAKLPELNVFTNPSQMSDEQVSMLYRHYKTMDEPLLPVAHVQKLMQDLSFDDDDKVWKKGASPLDAANKYFDGMTNLGQTAFKEFFKSLNRNTIPAQLKMEQVIKIFRKYDSDKSNGIDFMELEDLLRDMKLGQKDMMQVSRRFEGVDEVKLHQFIMWFHEFSIPVDPSKLTMTEVMKTFDTFDKDGSGDLDGHELHKMVKALRLSKRNEDACKNDSRFNKSGKFSINKISFICWFHELHASNDVDPQRAGRAAKTDASRRSGSFSTPVNDIAGQMSRAAVTEEYTDRIGKVFQKNNRGMMSKLRDLIAKNNEKPGDLHNLYLRVCKKYKVKKPKAEFKGSSGSSTPFPDLPGVGSSFRPGDKVMAKVSRSSSRSQEATVSRVDGRHVIVRWANGKTQRLPIENVTPVGGSKPRKASGVSSQLSTASSASESQQRKKHKRRFEKLEKALKRANVSKSGNISQSDFNRALGPTGCKMKLSGTETRNVWSFMNPRKEVSVTIPAILDRLCVLLDAGSSLNGVTIKKDVQSFKGKFTRLRT